MHQYLTPRILFFSLLIISLICAIPGLGRQLPAGVYNTKWIDITNVTVNTNNSLTVNAGQPWGYGKGANTSNVLPPNTNGWVEFTSNNNGTFVIGFSTNEVVFDYNTFSYGIRNEGGAASTYEAWVGTSLGTFVTGDIYRISREGSQIRYYKNGTVVRTVSTNPAFELRVRATMLDGTLPVVTTSQSPQLIVTGTVTGVTSATATGSISVNVKGGTSPYTYSWTGGSTSNSLTNQLPGTYVVAITDAAGKTATRTFSIGYKMFWKDLAGVTESATILTKTGTTGWGSGGNSSNFLPPNTDGWVEFVANLNSTYMVGFSSSGSSYATNDMTFGIYNEGGVGNLFSNEEWTSTTLGSFFSGDIYRISREGSQMKYYRNGTVIRTISTNAALGLSVKVLMSSGTSPIVNCSMQSILQLKANVSSIESLNGKGGISITALGGTTPYTYLWSSGETTASIANKTAGTYSVTVTDAVGRSASQAYNIAYKSIWLPGQGVSESAGTLTKTGSPSWGYGAYGSNYLPANTNGWIEFVAGENATYVMGLSLAGQGFDYSNLSYSFRLESNGNLTAYQDWVATALGSYQAGDVLKIARVGTQVIYYKNGTAVRTITVSASQVLYTKAAVLSGTTPAPTTQLWIPAAEGEVPDLFEFKALKDLYDSLGGVSWNTATQWPTAGNWPSTATAAQMGTWYGITSSGGDITRLDLYYNNMTGRIPSSIAKLKKVNTMRVQYNNINGRIPSSISEMTSLSFLNLSNNAITGAIPESIGSLTNLSWLGLYNLPSLGGPLPASLFVLPNLESLYIYFTGISGSIPTVINLPKIKVMYLYRNQLTGTLPAALTNQTSLTNLAIEGNPQMTGNIPIDI
ncbi:MAG: hypothetical protein DI539_24790, partial [Flavobacterium psychrophilum]